MRAKVDLFFFFFFSSRRRHTRSKRDWSSDVCSSDLLGSPDHFALRLRKWRLTTRQTVLCSWAATAFLGGLAIVMMLSTAPVASALLAGIGLSSLLVALFLRRIEMSL